jgi:hypothetical protein
MTLLWPTEHSRTNPAFLLIIPFFFIHQLTIIQLWIKQNFIATSTLFYFIFLTFVPIMNIQFLFGMIMQQYQNRPRFWWCRLICLFLLIRFTACLSFFSLRSTCFMLRLSFPPTAPFFLPITYRFVYLSFRFDWS